MASSRRPTTPSSPKIWTANEIDTSIAKLRRRITEITSLREQNIKYDDARVSTAERNLAENVREIFGDDSTEYSDFRSYHIHYGGYNVSDDESDRQIAFNAGTEQSVLAVQGLIERLEEKRLYLASPVRAEKESQTQNGVAAADRRKVFGVHGHDEGAKQQTPRFLEKLHLEPVILGELADQGRTIIEKFEQSSDVSFAVVLLTPDDMASPMGQEKSPRPRARQNVILELGYFVGRLSRSRVAVLYKGSVEIPSDYHGILYTLLDDGGPLDAACPRAQSRKSHAHRMGPTSIA
jgi:predicted nucleotide-binding protein